MSRRLSALAIGLFLVGTAFLGVQMAAGQDGRDATIWYVDNSAPAGGDGLTWSTAFRYLQDALAAAAAGQEIRVGQGTYRPDRDANHPMGTGDRYATFALVSGVALRGGYAGYGAADPNARDIALYEAILSGDLAGDDAPGFVAREENSLHVLTGSGTDPNTLLEGFVITAGYADREWSEHPHCSGAGLLMIDGGAALVSDTFEDNWARHEGGGAFLGNKGAVPHVEYCTFSGNHCSGRGGGICASNCDPIVTHCTFTGNDSDDVGGGMDCVWTSNAQISYCTFDGNHADGEGGGFHNWTEGSPQLTDCTFSNNTATNGGGACNRDVNALTFTNCTFSQNQATDWGGGLDSWNGASPVLSGCTFNGNTAGYGGGGAVFDDGAPALTDCTFENNSVPTEGGGAVRVTGNGLKHFTRCRLSANSARYGAAFYICAGTVTLTDCDFEGNQASPHSGGGIYLQCENTVLQATGCDFLNNSAGDDGGALLSDWRTTATLSNCTFSGNHADDTGGAFWSGTECTLTATDCEFGMNSSDWSGGAVDLGGNSTGTLTRCIFTNNTSGNDGGAIYNAVTLIVTLETCTFSGNTSGTAGGAVCSYSTDLDVLNCTFTNNSAGNVGGALCPADNAMIGTVTNCTFTDNHAVWGGAVFSGGGAVNTFTGCDFLQNGSSYDGGAMRNDNGHTTFTACTFTGNTARNGGAVSGVGGGTLRLDHCTLDQNQATELGGALDNWDSGSPTVEACTFSANTAARGGAAFLAGQNTCVFTDCAFENNTATNGGGALRRENGQLACAGCTFTQNAATDGAGISVYGATATLEECDFAGNVASGAGGAVNHTGSSPATLRTCTMTSNQAGQGGGIYVVGANPIRLITCALTDNVATVGGGVDIRYATVAMLLNCIFTHNRATEAGGGGMHADVGSTATIANCRFNGNLGDLHGGAIKAVGGTLDMVNSTLAHNSAPSGGAIECWHTSNIEVDNCVLHANTGAEGPQVALRDNGTQRPTVTVHYSDVEGGQAQVFLDPGCTLVWDAGNIAADPHFVDALGADGVAGTPDDDLRLATGSPCIDAGDNEAVPDDTLDLDQDGNTTEPLPLDLLGQPRFREGPGWPNAGSGVAPIVDMGAYEVQVEQHAGDLNCDGAVNYGDINPFVWALNGYQEYYVNFPNCNWYNADCNLDGVVNYGDINPFVTLLLTR